jgi:hypothetical protein
VTASAPVPVRLLRLVEQLTASFAGSSDEQEAQLFAAAARGDEVLDVLEFAAARGGRPGVRAAGADARRGRRLLPGG